LRTNVLLILTIAECTRSLILQKVAVGEGLLFVAVAFYVGAANILNEGNCRFDLLSSTSPVDSLSL
jgi:succinate-acetate transporter protein